MRQEIKIAIFTLSGLVLAGCNPVVDKPAIVAEQQEIACPSVQLPKDRTKKASSKTAPLGIAVPSGANYFIKVVSVQGEEVSSFYMEGGTSRKVNVPFGSYRIKYASGQNWCGNEELFGQKTLLSEADQTFDFGIVGDQLVGYSVELIPQSQGNLSTTQIGRGDF
jgi:hypothetical protein